MNLCMLVCWTPNMKDFSSQLKFGKGLKSQKAESFIMGSTGPWDELLLLLFCFNHGA